ncbi:MAG: twin transmembrane helix small protein [Gammaproteobacteria bacterium]|jgi:hypothetical protein|nr:twin transmembrane helix small protein [Gammaproteobacteria bacterium]
MYKTLIIINLIAVLISLAFGGFFLSKDESGKQRVATVLTIRIGLSILLFSLLIIGYFMGYLSPNASPLAHAPQ